MGWQCVSGTSTDRWHFNGKLRPQQHGGIGAVKFMSRARCSTAGCVGVSPVHGGVSPVRASGVSPVLWCVPGAWQGK